MNHRAVWRSSVVLFIFALGAVPAAQGQLSWSARAGLTVPAGTFADYFRLGPTVGAQASFPLQDRVDLVVSGDFDHFNGHAYFGTPNLNLWRIQGGVLATLLGDRSESWSLEAEAIGGGANLRSQRDFYLESSTFGDDLSRYSVRKTSLTGSAGLRLRFGGGSRLSGFIGANGYWAGLGGEDAELLRLTEPDELDDLSAAMGYSITAGFTMRP